MDDLPKIIYSNGVFLIFNKECVLKLRRARIVAQLFGCCPKNSHQIATSDLPGHLSRYASRIIFENKLAIFYKLVKKQDISIQENETLHSRQLLIQKEKTGQQHVEQRTAELQKRKIRPTPERIGHLDDTKMKITVQFEPEPGFSSFDMVPMSNSEVTAVLVVDEDVMTVYRDLYKRGFYLTSGTKFGGDLLVYSGEPVRYHAQYVIRIVPGLDESIDLNSLDFNEMNAANRLCHNANKIPLFAVVYRRSETSDDLVKYWSLRQREYIEPNSRTSLYPVQSLDSHDSIPSDDNHSHLL